MEDERYRRGQIYTIRNIKDDTMIYVGSTIDSLSKRFYKHKSKCKMGEKCSLYSHIIDNDWSDWYIELYEMYASNNKKELERREGQVIREIGTINKKIEGRTDKEWYEDNKEKVLQKTKEYYEHNKQEILEYQKKYNESNKEKISQKKKEYQKKNAEKIAKKRSEQVCCNICGAFSTKPNLPRHQRTKRCMEILNITTSNTQDCE